jgi:hypothetical protein
VVASGLNLGLFDDGTGPARSGEATFGTVMEEQGWGGPSSWRLVFLLPATQTLSLARRELCPWRGISGHERWWARAQAIFLRVNSPLLPPSPTHTPLAASFPPSVGGLAPSVCLRDAAELLFATPERRATRVEGTAVSPRCGEEAASSDEGDGHGLAATVARSNFHDSEHKRKVVGAAAANAWWGRRRLTEPPPSLGSGGSGG